MTNPGAGRGYAKQNNASRDALKGLIARLTPAQLDHDLGDGWTVRATLAHLAFWDRHNLARLAAIQRAPSSDLPKIMRAWQGLVFAPDVGFISDYINAGAVADWRALSGDHVLSEVMRASEEMDAMTGSCPPGLVEAAMAAEMSRLIERYHHRNQHIDQIRKALGLPAGA